MNRGVSPYQIGYRTSALALCALMTLSLSAKADDWTRWRGPAGNGIVSEKGFSYQWGAAGPKRLWATKIGKSYAAVAVKGDRLYTMGEANGQETVYCLDARTGKPIWDYRYPHGKREFQADPNPTATTATPVLDGDRVYTLDREGVAHCFNAESGSILWKQDLRSETKALEPPFGFAGAPLIEGGQVLYNVGAHGVSLDKKTGKVLWKSGAGLAGHAAPVLYTLNGKRGVAFFNGSGIVGADIRTGRKLWEHKWKTRYDINAVDPTFFGDSVFISAYGRAQRVRLTGAKPEAVYESKEMQHTFVSPILLKGYLYGNGSGRLRCVDWETGKATWDSTGLGDGALIAAGNYLIALTGDGELRVAEANPTKYVELARVKVMEGNCWTQPVLANGRLYCRNNGGDLICLDVSP